MRTLHDEFVRKYLLGDFQGIFEEPAKGNKQNHLLVCALSSSSTLFLPLPFKMFDLLSSPNKTCGSLFGLCPFPCKFVDHWVFGLSIWFVLSPYKIYGRSFFWFVALPLQICELSLVCALPFQILWSILWFVPSTYEILWIIFWFVPSTYEIFGPLFGLCPSLTTFLDPSLPIHLNLTWSNRWSFCEDHSCVKYSVNVLCIVSGILCNRMNSLITLLSLW